MSIDFKNISMDFGSVQALDNVNLSLESGKIYGLLGRNGAGKSTLLNILTGRIFATDGDVTIDGDTAPENDIAQGKVYLMSEQTLYPEGMRIKEVLKRTKDFYPDFDEAYARRLADKFSLDVNKKVKALSTGYTSIFKLIVALAVNTPYIIFDEPVLGLDANHRDLFYRELVEKYSENPCGIVISTHLIEEVSSIIEEVIVIDRGRIIIQDACEKLLSSGYAVSGTAAAVESFVQGKKVIGTDVLGGLKTAYLLGEKPESVPAGMEIMSMDLQKLFIQLTNV